MRFLTKLRGSASNSAARVRALIVGMTLAMFAPFAMASGGSAGALATEVITKLTGVEADISSIFLLLIGILTAFVLYSLIKRATSKA